MLEGPESGEPVWYPLARQQGWEAAYWSADVIVLHREQSDAVDQIAALLHAAIPLRVDLRFDQSGSQLLFLAGDTIERFVPLSPVECALLRRLLVFRGVPLGAVRLGQHLVESGLLSYEHWSPAHAVHKAISNIRIRAQDYDHTLIRTSGGGYAIHPDLVQTR